MGIKEDAPREWRPPLQLVAERIELLGPIESDDGDLGRCMDRALDHRGSSTGVGRDRPDETMMERADGHDSRRSGSRSNLILYSILEER